MWSAALLSRLAWAGCTGRRLVSFPFIDGSDKNRNKLRIELLASSSRKLGSCGVVGTAEPNVEMLNLGKMFEKGLHLLLATNSCQQLLFGRRCRFIGRHMCLHIVGWWSIEVNRRHIATLAHKRTHSYDRLRISARSALLMRWACVWHNNIAG